jgi:hypothetical protein
MKRLLAILGGIIVLILVLLLVLPLLFRDKIAQRAKVEVNKSVNANVDWRDAGLTFFSHFPNLTLRLDNLTVANRGRFQGDTLAAMRHFGVVLDLASVLNYALRSKPIVVRGVELDQPRLNLIALEDGTTNWAITDTTKPAQPASSKPMAVSLRNVQIKDGTVSFDNRKARLKANISGFDQSLSGDFSQKQVNVNTKADADTVSVSFAGIPYLNRVRLGLNADVAADLANKVYTLKTTELNLNDLKLAVTGSARSVGKLLGLDLAFKAPSENFRSILSLVPEVYAHDFGKVKTSGSFSVAGKVKGQYGESAFPSFAINAKVDNAAFQYPDLPLPARGIVMDLALTNPGGSADSTVVNLSRFHLQLGSNPVDATLLLKTPVSDPNVDMRLKGKVDLADVRRTVKLQNVDQLSGTIAADAAVRTRMSAIDKKQYNNVAASGTIDVANLTLKGKTLPLPMAIRQASLRLAPERANLTAFNGTIGSSDLQATGAINNLISYAFRDDTLQGTATVRSNHFDLDEWRTGGGNLQIIPIPPKIDFALNATVKELTYDKLTMSEAQGRVRIKDQRATLEDFRMNTLGGQIALNGYYETKDTTKPAFDVGFKMSRIDIPSAFKAFLTVQMLAPVAKYATGTINTDLHLNGALGKNMLPLFKGLTGKGALQTANIALHDFPAMNKLVDVTKLQILNNPTMQAIRTGFQIQEGRLAVNPFTVKVGPVAMNIAGSNGIDQSLQYHLDLKVPSSLLGNANQELTGLVSKAGLNPAAVAAIPLGVELTGTVTNPAVKVDVANLASTATQGATEAVKQAATANVDTAAQKLVQEAEARGAAIRQQAESLAAKVKLTGNQQADSLTTKAGDNPLMQAGAKVAADKLRQESDTKAQGIVNAANKRADSLVAAAKRQAGVK